MLHMTISHRVIWCGASLLDTDHLSKVLHYFGFKVLGLVAVKADRKSIMCKEIVKQDPGGCLHSLVYRWESHVIASKVGCYEQSVLITTL